MADQQDSSRIHVLAVCTGNVCRSSYLERRLRHELGQAAGFAADSIASAGTGALAGNDMDPHSRELLRRRQGEGEPFEARQITKPLVQQARLIITMTRPHRTAVARLDPRSMAKTHALLDLVRLLPFVTLPDPEYSQPMTPETWLDLLVPQIARLRGTIPTLAEDQSAILDPIGRGMPAFEAMAAQIEVTLPPLVRALTPPNM